MNYWFVGATYGEVDQSERFTREGIWVRGGMVPRYAEAINTIQCNDRIAIKSTYTKRLRDNLPFDNERRVISVMAIKATGIVLENSLNGQNLKVQWNWINIENPREWYFYTNKRTVWHPRAQDWRTTELVNFAFENEEQDIDRFKSVYFNR